MSTRAVSEPSRIAAGAGLIDCRWDATPANVSQIAALAQDIAFIDLAAGQEPGPTLLRGVKRRRRRCALS